MSIADLRRSYAIASLDERDVDPDPITQFERWFGDAQAAGVAEPNAMILATASRDGMPSARTVLLKGVDARGFVFFTDYRSRKGRDLDENPRAAICFLWKEIERQVRIAGTTSRVDADESAAYYESRPRGSRLGAWASAQSSVIPDRAALDAALERVVARFGESGDVPLPPHWGGYRLAPDELEFWQGRPDRLHDRLRYRRSGGAWIIERLSP
jgi:pyridoxamine 5'-phosphate oxidase